MPEEASLKFRSDALERKAIAERNKNAAVSILSQAGIMEDNPLYKKYFAYTMANVHHAGRYGVYDEQIEQMFVQSLQDPEMSLEQYQQVTKKFEASMAESQMKNATGSVFNGNKSATPFSEIRDILQQTTRDGVQMRNDLDTSFPKEFYNRDGSLNHRLIVDIPPEMMGDSAMGAIGLVTKKYKNVTFDKESNSFLVKGKPIGPEKFFKNKKELLDKFDTEKLDLSDKELLDIVKDGDYNKFLELRKDRGMNRDKTNEMLRNMLNDEVVFGEVSEKLRATEIDKNSFAEVTKSVAEDFDSKAKIVRAEADKATLDSIDRVMFSVAPADVARQSTFQDWKSCMHAVGCNHKYVDDSIGVGSIIAYGYNSDNPQKMVSRLLIHPYANDEGEVAYKVNDRIYGKENLAFRNVVNNVVDKNFNEGKEGAFRYNYKLYNDNAGQQVLNIINVKEGEIFDLDNRYISDGMLDLSGVDLSKAKDVVFSGTFEKISLLNTKFPEQMKQLDLSKCSALDLSGADLSMVEDLKLPSSIEGLKGTKFPETLKQLDLSKCSALDLSGVDLSQVEDLRLPIRITSLEGTKFPKKIDFSGCSALDLSGVDLSLVEDLTLPSGITSLEKIKFPETLKQLDLSKCYGLDLSGVDLSQFEDLRLPSNIKGLNGTKFPETLKQLDLRHCYGLDLSGADLSQFEDLMLPSNIKGLNGTKFPETLKQLDLRHCYDLDLSGADLSQLENLKLPSNIESLEGIKLPKKLDISYCHSLELTETDLAQFDELTVGRCSDMDLSTFKGELKFSQNIEFINTKLPPSMHSLDLTGKQAIFQNTDFGGIQELKFPEYFFSGMEQAGEKIGELCGGDGSKLEKMSFSVITPDCKLDNLKKLDAQACKNLDLRDWNLDKMEELTLPKNFDVSKLPEGIMERNPAVARAVKISHGEMVETLEPVQNVVKEKVDLPPEIKTEKTVQNAENPAAERIQQLRGVEHSAAQPVAEAGERTVEKTVEKTVAHAGAEAVKSSDGIVSAIAKADNAVNQAIDKTIDKGSELLNNNAVGRAYEKAAEKVADTKIVKAVEKTTAKAVEKAANTAVGKAVVKTAAKAAGSAVGKSVIKKIPLVSVAAGCYFAWDRIKDGDWKGACGEVASGVAGCFPGLGTAASAAIDVGLAAKDIKTAVDESKQPVAEATPNTVEEKTASVEQTEDDKKKMRDIILQKQGRISSEVQAQVQQPAQQNYNFALQQKTVQQGRG